MRERERERVSAGQTNTRSHPQSLYCHTQEVAQKQAGHQQMLSLEMGKSVAVSAPRK